MPPQDPLPEWVRHSRLETGARIRDLRIHRNLTQEQLAEQIGVDRRMIHYYETGATELGLDRITQIAHALGVPIWRLFRDEET